MKTRSKKPFPHVIPLPRDSDLIIEIDNEDPYNNYRLDIFRYLLHPDAKHWLRENKIQYRLRPVNLDYQHSRSYQLRFRTMEDAVEFKIRFC